MAVAGLRRNGWIKKVILVNLAVLSLILLSAVMIQALDWINRNGLTSHGTCVNHFGEPYPCRISGWLKRILSPFSCIPYLLILQLTITTTAVTSRILKNKNQAKPKKHKQDTSTIPKKPVFHHN